MDYMSKMKDFDEGKLGDGKILDNMGNEELENVAQLLDQLMESAKEAENANPIPGFPDPRPIAKEAEQMIKEVGREIEKEIVQNELEPHPPSQDDDLWKKDDVGSPKK